MSEYGSRREPEPSGWAIGGYIFAGTLMILIGIFQAFAGLAAVIEDEFYVVAPNYVYDVDVTAWGWIHLILGIVLVLAGFSLFAGATWSRIVGSMLAVLSAVANFLFIPYYPFWSLLMIALAVWVIWALTRPLEGRA